MTRKDVWFIKLGGLSVVLQYRNMLFVELNKKTENSEPPPVVDQTQPSVQWESTDKIILSSHITYVK
jgi:hypothetical protein